MGKKCKKCKKVKSLIRANGICFDCTYFNFASIWFIFDVISISPRGKKSIDPFKEKRLKIKKSKHGRRIGEVDFNNLFGIIEI